MPRGASRGEAIPTSYPSELEQEVVLHDGTAVRLRPILPRDAGCLTELYDRLSLTTAYQRFFTVMKRLPPDWARMLATVDYRRRLALVAEQATPAAVEVVAVARYEPASEPDTAEVAIVVQDAWQGRGLGPILLTALLAAAEARAIHRFVAYVLADNSRMLRVLRRLADIETRTVEAGVVTLVFTPRKEQ